MYFPEMPAKKHGIAASESWTEKKNRRDPTPASQNRARRGPGKSPKSRVIAVIGKPLATLVSTGLLSITFQVKKPSLKGKVAKG
jgi:hypothetical protein